MTHLHVPDTERLTYALMDDSDAQLLWELDQDVEVMRYINGGEMTSMEDIINTMLPRMNSYRNPEDGWGIWKVLTKSDATYLGWILVRPMHFFSEERDDNNLELGWRFHRQHWGYGYATEAAKALMVSLHDQKGINQFTAIAEQDNNASINIMKKLGMQFDKRELYKDPLLEAIVDYYSIENYST